MRCVRNLSLVVALLTCGSMGQLPDTICLVDDLPELFELGLLLDTGGAMSMMDSVVVTGGDCDSVSASLYMSGSTFGFPMTVVIQDSCTVAILVLGGFIDTTIDLCPAGIRAPMIQLAAQSFAHHHLDAGLIGVVRERADRHATHVAQSLAVLQLLVPTASAENDEREQARQMHPHGERV